MKSKDKSIFLEALDELEKEKGIKKGELLERIKLGILAAYKKDFHDEENSEVEIDEITGEVKIFSNKVIVDDYVEYDSNIEIPLSKAKDIKKRVKLGDVLKVEINAEEFKRNAIQRAKSIVVQYVREQEKENLIRRLKQLEGLLVAVTVKRVEHNGNLFLDMNGIDTILPAKELSSLDKFKQGDKTIVYVKKIDVSGKFPKIDLTRTDEKFMRALFAREIPEVESGIIEIKNIAREFGVKSKVAIYSKDPNIDLKGSCIGKDGSRINAILNILNGEKIELVEWNEDQRVYVKNALYPAELFSVEIVKNNEEIIAKVEVEPDQLTLAIGKKGINSKLAGKLCRLRINIEARVEDGEDTENEEE